MISGRWFGKTRVYRSSWLPILLREVSLQFVPSYYNLYQSVQFVLSAKYNTLRFVVSSINCFVSTYCVKYQAVPACCYCKLYKTHTKHPYQDARSVLSTGAMKELCSMVVYVLLWMVFLLSLTIV